MKIWKPYNNILVIMLQCERCLSTDIWGSWKGFPMAGCCVNGIAMRPHYLPHKLLRDKPDVWPDMSHLQRRAGIGSGTFSGICSRKCSLFLVNISEVFPKVIVSKGVHWKRWNEANPQVSCVTTWLRGVASYRWRNKLVQMQRRTTRKHTRKRGLCSEMFSWYPWQHKPATQAYFEILLLNCISDSWTIGHQIIPLFHQSECHSHLPCLIPTEKRGTEATIECQFSRSNCLRW